MVEGSPQHEDYKSHCFEEVDDPVRFFDLVLGVVDSVGQGEDDSEDPDEDGAAYICK